MRRFALLALLLPGIAWAGGFGMLVADLPDQSVGQCRLTFSTWPHQMTSSAYGTPVRRCVFSITSFPPGEHVLRMTAIRIGDSLGEWDDPPMWESALSEPFKLCSIAQGPLRYYAACPLIAVQKRGDGGSDR